MPLDQVTPAGMLALAKENLIDMVAASSNFQSRTGAATAAAAEAFVYRNQLVSYDRDILRPYAIVYPDAAARSASSGGARNYWSTWAGAWRLYLTDENKYLENSDDAYADFEDWVFNVVDDVLALAAKDSGGSVSYLPFTSVEASVLPIGTREDMKDGDDYFVAEFLFGFE